MATKIITAHNLATGAVQSTALTNVEGLIVQAIVTGSNSSTEVTYMIMAKEGDGAYTIVRDEDGNGISFKTIGNQNLRLAIPNVNSESVKIYVTPNAAAVGSLTIESNLESSSAIRFEDVDGVVRGFKVADGKPRISTSPYLYDISEGNITGHVPWSKIGFNPAIGTTEEDVWSAGGSYVFPSAAGKMEVVSSNNTQDIGTVIKSGTATGGSITTLIDTGADFTAATAVAVGDCVILDKSGTTPEYGYVTAVAATQLTIAGGFSMGGTGSGRTYSVIDKSAKTGAHAVKIVYLKPDYTEKTEFVILNGTTAVDLVNEDIFRINSFRVIATGTGNVPVGNLIFRADGAGTTYSYITAGFTRARNSAYTVPAGKSLYIVQFTSGFGTTGNANKEYCRIYTRANIEPFTGFNTGSIFFPLTEVLMQNSTTVIQLEVPTILPAKTDLKISAIATATGAVNTVLRGWTE